MDALNHSQEGQDLTCIKKQSILKIFITNAHLMAAINCFQRKSTCKRIWEIIPV